MKRFFLSLIFIMIALVGVSCASASSDFNDTAVEFDHDIAPVNDDLGNVIVNNVSVNDDADVRNVIANDVSVNDDADVSNVIANDVSVNDDADVSNVIANDVALNNYKPQQKQKIYEFKPGDHYYIELTRLNSTILPFSHDSVIHAVKLRVLHSRHEGHAVANVPVAFNILYSNDRSSFDTEKMVNLYKNKPHDTYTTFGVSDKDGYVTFYYRVNPDPNIYAYCWFEPVEMYFNKLFPVNLKKAFSVDMWEDNINGDFNVKLTILQ